MVWSYRILFNMIGASLMAMLIFGVFAEFMVRNQLIHFEDPVATFHAIQNAQLLFKAGIFAFIVVLLLDVVLSISFYLITKNFHEPAALLAMSLRLLYVGIKGFAITGLVMADDIYSSSLTAIHIDALANSGMQFLKMHHHGFSIGLIFFGMHLIVLSLALSHASHLPKFIICSLRIGGVGYTVTSLIHIVGVDLEITGIIIIGIFILPMTFSELALGFWLWTRGKRLYAKDQQNLFSALKDAS